MNYELVKQLHNAGFPFRAPSIGEGFNQHGEFVKAEQQWITPTLEELIEACGRTIESGPELYYFTLWGEPHEWQAGFTPLWKEAVYANALGAGSTPAEAVARLWLALNKN